MRLKHYLYITTLVLLTACNNSDELTDGTPRANDAIQLSAGIVKGSHAVMTRAAGDTYQALTEGTAIALQVSGTWTGHTQEEVVKTTTAEAELSTKTSNGLSLTPVLYWDDYGMADPANATTGRTTGLTIYGAAVNGLTTAPAISNYTALVWDVNADQTTGWSEKDLLISNNVKADNTYKFDARDTGKQLEFRHALSKVTVSLKAGEGFADSKFVNDPTVTLLDWAHTNGTVNVTDGTVTLGNNTGVTMYQAATAATGYNVTKEALVMPGSAFIKGADIIRINADDNIYYVSSEKIRAAINAADHDTDDLTKAGKNYIIKVTVNKTDIQVSATVVDWTTVEATEEHPKILVNNAYGDKGKSFDKAFDFYRSTSLNNGYSKDAEMSYATATGWTMTPQLYWPDHLTHYQFRGVWPTTAKVVDGKDATMDMQVIKVNNVAYQEGTFPSDLLIARPEIAEDAVCTNKEPGHTTTKLFEGGICATEGNINLNFRYMMAQVEVNLITASSGDNQVNLTGAKVELVNVKNTGDVTLGTREVVPTGVAGEYVLDEDANDANKRLSAIVPQDLSDMKFRITITNGTDETDVYYADVASIVDQTSNEKITAWKSGEHYVYALNLQKTKLTVSATLTDWKKVNASENVWF